MIGVSYMPGMHFLYALLVLIYAVSYLGLRIYFLAPRPEYVPDESFVLMGRPRNLAAAALQAARRATS